MVAGVCNGNDRHAKARIDTQSRQEPEAGPRLTRGLVSFFPSDEADRNIALAAKK